MISAWLKILPATLRARIESSPNLQKALTNTGWLFGNHILRIGVGLFVGVWLARYLGPELFGLLNFGMAFIALFGFISTLGLKGIVVRDIVNDPSCAQVTLGTSFVLQLIGGLISCILVIIVINFLRADDELAKIIITILSFILIMKASEVVKYWFEANVQSKYAVWVDNVVLLFFASIKIGMILIGMPLITFVWLTLAEAIFASLALLMIYMWKGGKLAAWKLNCVRAKYLLRNSWPLILSGLAIVLYMRIDQLMLGQILNDEAVGIYTVAVRISEAWYFIPMSIVASVFPYIIEAKKQSEASYYKKLQKLYDLMVILALVVAVPMTFLSDWLVVLLFGKPYIDAGNVLAIHIWAGVFVFLGVASSKWFLVEGLQKMQFKRTLLGAIANILMNSILIPLFGVTGAAIATVISYSLAAYLSDAIWENTRFMFAMKSKSFYQNSLLIKNLS